MVTGKSEQKSKHEGSINPKDETFNFDLWAKAVRSRMIKVLEKKLEPKSLTT